MKTTVIYHSADFDGIFCREIAKFFLRDCDVEYVGWDYGDPVPKVPEENKLLILDLSIDELMNHPRLIWIDHHKTAIDKFSRFIQGYRIDGVAACRLTYQWFTTPDYEKLPDKPMYIDRRVREPRAVILAGEYDVWDKRDLDAEVFQFGLRSRELSTSDWELMLSGRPTPDVVSELLSNGRLLQRYQQQNDASVVKYRAFDLDFEGFKFIALNTARCNSLTFTAGLKPEHDACCGFFWNGKKWKVSLYGVPGKPNVDLSTVAVKYGGGGHKQACGFEAEQLPFLAR